MIPVFDFAVNLLSKLRNLYVSFVNNFSHFCIAISFFEKSGFNFNNTLGYYSSLSFINFCTVNFLKNITFVQIPNRKTHFIIPPN